MVAPPVGDDAADARLRQLLVPFASTVRLAWTPAKGHHLLAARDIEAGERLLSSRALLSAVLPSWRRRLCAHCLKIHPTRLLAECACAGCGQAYYCGDVCRAAHARGERPAVWEAGGEPDTTETVREEAGVGVEGAGARTGGGAGASPQPEPSTPPPRTLPHSLLCPVLARFASSKGDADLDAVLVMVLQALGHARLEADEAAGGAGAAGDPPPCPPVGSADLDLLASHAGDMTKRRAVRGGGGEGWHATPNPSHPTAHPVTLAQGRGRLDQGPGLPGKVHGARGLAGRGPAQARPAAPGQRRLLQQFRRLC